VTTDAYDVPRSCDFRKYTGEAFGIEKGTRAADVVIRFGPRQARWIRERKCHRSARMQEEIGGGLVLRLRVAETSELRRGPTGCGLAPELRLGMNTELTPARHPS
jgi:hypothetical protein